MSRLTIKYDPTKYWLDDDGYIAYGVGDDYETVAEVLTVLHCQGLSSLIESHAALLEACKQAKTMLEHIGGCFDTVNKLKAAIAAAEPKT